MDSGSPATVFWEEKIYLIGRARKQSRINMKNKERNGGGKIGDSLVYIGGISLPPLGNQDKERIARNILFNTQKAQFHSDMPLDHAESQILFEA